MAAPQRGGQDSISREAQEDKGRRREDTLRLGAAECGLCLDEFLDSGNKVPRNLLCGHTFCTGSLHNKYLNTKIVTITYMQYIKL